MGQFRSKPKPAGIVQDLVKEARPEPSVHSLPHQSIHSADKSEVEIKDIELPSVPPPEPVRQSYFKKKIEIRKTLTRYEEILESDEAHEIIKIALLDNPPGGLSRWDKIVKQINVITLPTEKNPSPFNVEITLNDLRKLLSAFYSSVTSVDSEGVVLMRQNMSVLFEKVLHSFCYHSIFSCPY